MAFITINGAQIYYEVYGEDRLGEPPVLLIHGSTTTGWEDWGRIAPVLAHRRRVIVPDCRGHGRSSNPHRSYRFTEMAADLAELIHTLGYERAHLIGHSNGGNVALVMLMEHPDVVQTAVLQAANAYVDQYLIEREPQVFNPDRVAREAPEWKDQMTASHIAAGDPDYWRALLAMTLAEILSAPDYTPAELATVSRPTMVIQGELDPVNAPSGHAEYIALHIPDAELWVPQGIAHNVHHQIGAEWVRRVESFIERRSDPANDALYRLGREHYADRRQWVFDVRAARELQPGNLQLSGQVLRPEQRQAAVERLQPAQIDAGQVRVLLTAETGWALVDRGLTDLRREPRSSAERVSQALLGEAVRVLETGDEWCWVCMERDGYLGWINSAALFHCTGTEVADYRSQLRHCVIAELLPAWADRQDVGEPASACAKLPFGVNVAVQHEQKQQAQICLPDGRRWWVETAGLEPLAERAQSDAAAALQLIRRFVGVPYLWGGRTPFGYDCSGLSGAFWEYRGVVLARDADQQFTQGMPVSGEPQPGDLLFFAEPLPALRGERMQGVRTPPITHVAIALGGWRIIHATGALGGVVINSLDPDSPEYRPWLHENLIGIRRMG